MSAPILEPRVSVVIPAYEEGDAVVPVLDRLFEAVTLPVEVVVVVDSAEDSTVAVVEKYAHSRPNLRWVLNTYGRGPANAIRYGIDHARAPVAVVTMSDGSDDPQQIDELTRLVERGVVIAAASRYMPGGQQVGGPLLKGLMSRAAGRSCTPSPGSGPGTRRTRSRRIPRNSSVRSVSTAGPGSRSVWS